jgi:acyl carrier protein
MNRGQIEAIVLAVLASVLQCEVDINCSRHNTPRWDSLKHVEIVFTLEDELNVEFTEEQMATLDSAQKIIEMALTQHAT